MFRGGLCDTVVGVCIVVYPTKTYLLLGVWHPTHAELTTPLHSHWVAVGGGRYIWLAGVRPALLLLLGVGVAAAHPIQLRALHHHEVHGAHLRKHKNKARDMSQAQDPITQNGTVPTSAGIQKGKAGWGKKIEESENNDFARSNLFLSSILFF